MGHRGRPCDPDRGRRLRARSRWCAAALRQDRAAAPQRRVRRLGQAAHAMKNVTTMVATSVLPKHLRRLEAESIEIIREVAAEFKNPVMLYSIGKDSSVMLHLAVKAFHPSPLPFPLMHVDTTWKFREMIAFRDQMARKLNAKLIVHVNEEGIAKGINPFSSGSQLHTHVMKTEGLKQALDK